jgi:plasmid maintenance system antidote protein VapI
MPIAEPLRKAIRESGQSVTSIAKATGIPQPVLSRFMNGQDIRVEATAEKLARYFGMTIEPPAKSAKPAKGKGRSK